jgi:hypothetical protein
MASLENSPGSGIGIGNGRRRARPLWVGNGMAEDSFLGSLVSSKA